MVWERELGPYFGSDQGLFQTVLTGFGKPYVMPEIELGLVTSTSSNTILASLVLSHLPQIYVAQPASTYFILT